MEFKQETRAISATEADAVAVGLFQGEDVSEIFKMSDPQISESLTAVCQSECQRANFSGKVGQMVQIATHGQIIAKNLVLVGLGQPATTSTATLRKMAAACARRLAEGRGNETVALRLRWQQTVLRQASAAAAAPEQKEIKGSDAVQALVEGWTLGCYRFKKYKTADEDAQFVRTNKILINAPEMDAEAFAGAVDRGSTIATATAFARDMIAEPPCFMTPGKLAELALGLGSSSISCQILDRSDVEKLGMGAFLGVARGASEPPKFIVLRYMHPEAQRTIGIAGKGITFDSGGLSIKNAQSMEHMKYDMTGAAVVIAAMQAIGKLQPKLNVVAVAAATENMPGPAAMHPGDIVTAMNGKTIEVNNTDAEGRLVLADALCYLGKEGPDEMIDVATLTGAVVTALGRAAAGIMGNNELLIKRIIDSGAAAGEKFWSLPLYDEYKEVLKSDVADLKNAGARGEAGSPAGGMFLKEFVNGKPWVHLDIAGPAWMDKEKEDLNKGGTAFGVRTLCYYLLSQAAD